MNVVYNHYIKASQPLGLNDEKTARVYHCAMSARGIPGLQEGQIIRLFSADGKVVYAGKDADINLDGMANGVYSLKVGKDVVKIIKK